MHIHSECLVFSIGRRGSETKWGDVRSGAEREREQDRGHSGESGARWGLWRPDGARLVRSVDSNVCHRPASSKGNEQVFTGGGVKRS